MRKDKYASHECVLRKVDKSANMSEKHRLASQLTSRLILDQPKLGSRVWCLEPGIVVLRFEGRRLLRFRGRTIRSTRRWATQALQRLSAAHISSYVSLRNIRLPRASR